MSSSFYFFKKTSAEFIDGARVVYDFYFGLHVDLSKTVVYVADML